MEQVVVIVFKTISAFFFLTVTARFVTVYNNLNPDAKAFNQGLDALNSFVAYFNLAKADMRAPRVVSKEFSSVSRANPRNLLNFDSILTAGECIRKCFGLKTAAFLQWWLGLRLFRPSWYSAVHVPFSACAAVFVGRYAKTVLNGN